MRWGSGMVLLACAVMVGCGQATAPREALQPAVLAEAKESGMASSGPAVPVLEDVVESAPTHMVGISYPRGLDDPGLVAALQAYAAHARTALAAALETRAADAPPYDLTLEFRIVHESPALVAVAADGSTYTGGRASQPLAGRFVWLRGEERLLTAADLIPDETDWSRISGEVRGELRSVYARQAHAVEGTAGGGGSQAPNARDRPVAGRNEVRESMFEPVPGPDGRIAALHFVFPATRLDTGLQDTRTVAVPANALRPHVASRYRELFTQLDI